MKRKEEIEARNRADQAVYAAERMIKDSGDKLPPDQKAAVESAIEELKTANAGTDAAAVNAAMDKLTKAQHAAAESLYKQAQASGAGGGGATGGGTSSGGASASDGAAKDDVIDAEVVDDK
jgi:molecular chaperone DnaK